MKPIKPEFQNPFSHLGSQKREYHQTLASNTTIHLEWQYSVYTHLHSQTWWEFDWMSDSAAPSWQTLPQAGKKRRYLGDGWFELHVHVISSTSGASIKKSSFHVSHTPINFPIIRWWLVNCCFYRLSQNRSETTSFTLHTVCCHKSSVAPLPGQRWPLSCHVVQWKWSRSPALLQWYAGACAEPLFCTCPYMCLKHPPAASFWGQSKKAFLGNVFEKYRHVWWAAAVGLYLL